MAFEKFIYCSEGFYCEKGPLKPITEYQNTNINTVSQLSAAYETYQATFVENLPGSAFPVKRGTLELWTSETVLCKIPLYDAAQNEKGYISFTCVQSNSTTWFYKWYVSLDGNIHTGSVSIGNSFEAGTSNVWGEDNYIQFLTFEHVGDKFLSFRVASTNRDNSIKLSGNGALSTNAIAFNLTALANKGYTTGEIEWSDEFGEPSEEEGYEGGSFDDSSDTIDIPDMPTLGVSSAGFVHLYEVSNQELVNFGGELFPAFSGISIPSITAPTDVTDAVYQMAEALAAIGNNIGPMITVYINKNLIDYVLDCHIIPVSPTTGSHEAITVGWRVLNTTADRVSSDYVDFDCGSISIQEYYGNYIDYAGTKCKLFLPFVGYVELEPEYWQSGTLSVKYRFNVIDGSFQAFVLSTSSKSNLTSSVIAQYGGNCIIHIPVTGLNYSNLASAAVSAVAAPVMTAAGGGAVAASAASSAANVAEARPSVQSSNGYSSSSSFLSGRTPYLIIEREVSSFSTKYNEEQGLPLNVTKTLGSVSGFTIASDLILSGFSATDQELDEIRSAFSEGVIL